MASGVSLFFSEATPLGYSVTIGRIYMFSVGEMVEALSRQFIGFAVNAGLCGRYF